MKHHLTLIAIAAVLVGCGTPPQPPAPPTRLPTYNLGAANTTGDDIAPFLDSTSRLLYFTTDGMRDSAKTILSQGCYVPDQDFAVAIPRGNNQYDTSRLRATPLALLLSVLGNNEGNIAFVSPREGFFASGHPFEESYAHRIRILVGGLVGGTDLFHFTIGADEKLSVTNLQPLNSFYWDAHPTTATRNDTLLLIFSSDRPALTASRRTRGLSAPFRNQRSFDGRDTVFGNADLYAAFRLPNGQWTAPFNLNDALGERINSRGNEYSPFLFCSEGQPVLYFASDRRENASPTDTTLDSTLNLWAARLSVDYGQRRVIVHSLERLPTGPDTINTATHHELFPYIPPPHRTADGRATLYLASDRDDTVRHWSSAVLVRRRVDGIEIHNRGGFDLYAIPIETSCRPPRILYTVTVLDRQDPKRPVRQPLIVIESDDGARIEQNSSSVRLELKCGTTYRTRGGGLYDSVECTESSNRVLSHYAERRILERDPVFVRRVVRQQRTIIRTADTVRRPLLIPAHMKQQQSFDTAAFKTLAQMSFAIGADEQFVGIRRRSPQVMDALYARRRAQPDTIVVIANDTLIERQPQYDTVVVPVRRSLVLSELSKRGGFPACDPSNPLQSDLELFDTIYVEPQYYVFPPCSREFLYDTQFVRNVPYYQTNFWEVNTVKGFTQHLHQLQSSRYADAGFIELHRQNRYWGPDYVADLATRSARTRRWQARIEQYRRYAQYVERNYQIMTRSICDTLLPGFADMIARLPSTDDQSDKIIISVVAYSDARPIQRGTYLGDSIAYFSTYFDTVRYALEFPSSQPVIVRHGASLVGNNNDTLSKLRAYYGYQELLNRLRQCPVFADFERHGQVLLPTDVGSPDEFYARLSKSRIIIVVEGRYADTTTVAKIPSYTATRLLYVDNPEAIHRQQSGDYFSYDSVRRVDVAIHRIHYSGGMLRRPVCGCRQGE